MKNGKRIDSKKNLQTLVRAICGVVLIIFAFTSLFLLNSAGNVADRVRLKAEMDLVRNEIDRQIEIVARDQSQISHWNATIEALGETINRSFVREEISGWLWSDFDIKDSIIVGEDGAIRVSVHKNAILKANSGEDILAQNRDLVETAKVNYFDHRVSMDGGYTIEGDTVFSDHPLYAGDIREIRGEVGVIIAQAIVPHGSKVLPEGNPHILLTFKPVSDSDLAYMQHKLQLSGLNISPKGATRREHATSVQLGHSGLWLEWDVNTPSDTIWQQGLPVVLILLGLVGAGLVAVSGWYGRMVFALQESEEKNKFLAMHDALTGLPNRLHFDRVLEDVISRNEQDRCAILCLDLDRFKAVNDVYGHQAGDEVIKTVSARISGLVGEAGTVARIGGDEFIILLKDRLEHNSVLSLCDSIIHRVCEPVEFDGGTAAVGASIGVAWWPDDAKTAKTIIRSADEALYRAKESGRGKAFLASGKACGRTTKSESGQAVA